MDVTKQINGRKNNNGLVAKVFKSPTSVKGFILKNKKWIIGALVVLLLLSIYRSNRPQTTDVIAAKTQTVSINRGFDMSALTNTGKVAKSKVRFTLTTADKTNKVIVKDQEYTAQNDKTFLIVNLQIKNDADNPLNILPGDLIRLSYGNDSENKYAPDLHNNLVLAAAISTKNDRVGFVVPESEKNFTFFVGELDGKKTEIDFNFPS